MMEPTPEEVDIVRVMGIAQAPAFVMSGHLKDHAFIWPLNGWAGRSVLPLQLRRLETLGLLQRDAYKTKAAVFRLSELGQRLSRAAGRMPGRSVHELMAQMR